MRFILVLEQIFLVISMIPVSTWSWSPAGSIARATLRFRRHAQVHGERRRVPALTVLGSRTKYSFRLYSTSDGNDKKRVVFLGTPDVAATTLRSIYDDSLKENSAYEVVAVVTQPPKKRGRKKDKLEPSPVAVMAEELGIPAMWPEKVRALSNIRAVYLFNKLTLRTIFE